jgi:hypothetical protein
MDIEVTNHGTIWQFRGLTDEGKAFLTDNIESEPWQWLGDRLGVDHRMARQLLDVIEACGLTYH